MFGNVLEAGSEYEGRLASHRCMLAYVTSTNSFPSLQIHLRHDVVLTV